MRKITFILAEIFPLWFLALLINAIGITGLLSAQEKFSHISLIACVLVFLITGMGSIPAFILFFVVVYIRFDDPELFQRMLVFGMVLVGGSAWVAARIFSPIFTSLFPVVAVPVCSIVTALFVRMRSIRLLPQQFKSY